MPVGRVSDIDLRWLYVFINVVEAGGYSAAQAELNIGLATISSHMKSLEDRLGMRLCKRGRAGFQLTEEGKIVYKEAVHLKDSMDRFASISQSLGKDLAGRLHLGIADAITNAGNMLIADTIRKFNERENDVQIHLHSAGRQALERAVLEGTYDLAIGFFAAHYSGLTSQPLYKESHALYCGVGHPLFGETRKIEQAELSKLRIASRSFAAIDDCERLGSVQRGAVVTAIEAELTMLLSGSYIGFLPVRYAERWVETGQLHKLNSPESQYDSPHSLICRQKSSLSKPAKLFIRDLIEVKKAFADQF